MTISNFSKLIKLFTIFFSSSCLAQNLVANNSFETYSSLPSGPGQWWKVTGWNNVNNVAVFAWPYASPDYLSTNGTGNAHLPNSIFGTVNPFSGNAVMGFVAYYYPGASDFREYISRPLSSPMTIGQTYTVSFMMTNGSSNQYSGSGCNHVGVHFSVNPLSQSQHEPINVTPQCEITTVWWSTSWQQVTFSFTATAAYQYLTIGNFANDANTSHTVYNSSASSTFGAYYFIDEVSVIVSALVPVELISFTAENAGRKNIVRWSTAAEINNDFFHVERSADGIHFETIAEVDGHGSSTQSFQYEVEDNSPLGEINYYRLEQNDFDFTHKYSEIISIKNILDDNCFVYHDAMQGCFVLHCSGSVYFKAEILSADGSSVKVMALENVPETKIDLNEFSKGFYYLRVTGKNDVRVFKLMNR